MLPTVPLATDRGARAHTVDVGQVPIEFRVGKFTNFTGLYSYSADGMQIGPCGVVRAQAAPPAPAETTRQLTGATPSLFTQKTPVRVPAPRLSEGCVGPDRQGYSGDGKGEDGCLDLDECLARPCKAGHSCSDSTEDLAIPIGEYKCEDPNLAVYIGAAIAGLVFCCFFAMFFFMKKNKEDLEGEEGYSKQPSEVTPAPLPPPATRTRTRHHPSALLATEPPHPPAPVERHDRRGQYCRQQGLRPTVGRDRRQQRCDVTTRVRVRAPMATVQVDVYREKHRHLHRRRDVESESDAEADAEDEEDEEAPMPPRSQGTAEDWKEVRSLPPSLSPSPSLSLVSLSLRRLRRLRWRAVRPARSATARLHPYPAAAAAACPPPPHPPSLRSSKG
jgi:hypothetical protein